MRQTGFFWHERCFWHGAGNFAFLTPAGGLVEPSGTSRLPEAPETKRRLKNLLDVSGLAADLVCTDAIIPADEVELLAVHTKPYIDQFRKLSEASGGELGLRTPFGPGGAMILRVCLPEWSGKLYLLFLMTSLIMPMPCPVRPVIIIFLISQTAFVC